MGFAASIVWEVRATGDDTNNGGGFDPTSGTPGTDYSQQDSAQVTYTDLVIDGTTNTKVTSAGNPFTSAHVGNVINVTGGTGFTVQRVQIMSVTASVATCDKSLGTLSSTGGTGKLGGALASPGKAAGLVSNALNFVYTKAGTYTFSSSSNVAGGRVSASAQFVGYSSNRNPWNTDTKPVIQPGANSMTCFDGGSSDGPMFSNLQVNNPNGKTGVTAFNMTFSLAVAWNLDISQVATGITFGQQGRVTGCSLNGSGITVGNDSRILGSVITNGNFVGSARCRAALCILNGNNGSGHGFSSFEEVEGCDVYNLTGVNLDGFRNCTLCINCHGEAVLGSGAYLFNKTVASPQDVLVNCAGYNNTANINTTYYPASRQVNFQSLPGSALTAPGSGDLTLNSTASRGAALRAAGWPAAFPSLTPTNYRDIGAYQHADPAAAGGLLIHPGMAGGMRG